MLRVPYALARAFWNKKSRRVPSTIVSPEDHTSGFITLSDCSTTYFLILLFDLHLNLKGFLSLYSTPKVFKIAKKLGMMPSLISSIPPSECLKNLIYQ